jgi:arylsulfatase A-like enzyme
VTNPQRGLARGAWRPAARLWLAALAVSLAACGGESRPWNVVFVLVDTLRADHLPTYGYARDTSPTVDAWARQAVVFEDARSQWSCTFPSVNSIFTSLPPARFLGQPDSAMGIPAGVPTLAEILRGQGYVTAAVSASPVVRATPGRFNPLGGFGAGFDVFHEDCGWKSAACVNRDALAEIGRLPEPFFLYLHYLEPHGPYRPPRYHSRRWAMARPEKSWVRQGDPNPIGEAIYKGAPDPGATAADLSHLIDLYDEEIAFFDTQFAELLAALRRRGVLERSILLLASDHGEEFLEHGDIKHCRNVYDTSIRTPLIVAAPGVAPARRSAGAQNLDIVPTLLDYLGIATDGYDFAGRSLRPAMEGEARVNPVQFASQGPLRAATDGRFKLITDLGARRAWLYDLTSDPGERVDVLAQSRRAYAALEQALEAWLERSEGDQSATLALARETEQQLRALGYLE